MAKRIFDIFFSSIGLIFLFPVLLLIAILIKIDSTGSVFFRQVRVGQNGKNFRIFKFRTMSTKQNSHLKITATNDTRITKIGHFLRKYKIDELPQLINVLVGQMSLVGPRPEVPEYVKMYPENIKAKILSIKPGITDLASIRFRDEGVILANSENPEQTYIKKIMPKKLAYYKFYANKNNLRMDCGIILRTIKAIF